MTLYYLFLSVGITATLILFASISAVFFIKSLQD